METPRRILGYLFIGIAATILGSAVSPHCWAQPTSRKPNIVVIIVDSYANLHRTYAALNSWCSQHALALTGQSWEVYGDWTEDPSKLETGLFLRVNEA